MKKFIVLTLVISATATIVWLAKDPATTNTRIEIVNSETGQSTSAIADAEAMDANTQNDLAALTTSTDNTVKKSDMVSDEFTYISDQNWDQVRSDYASYDLDALKQLAESGDGKAQLFYAINITNSDPNAATSWFKEAAINTAYAGIGRYAYDAEMLSSGMLSSEELAESNGEEPPPEVMMARMEDHFERAAVWAIYSKLRGDTHPETQHLNEMKFFFESRLPAERYAALEAKAQAFLEDIRNTRMQRGLGDFEPPA